MYSEIIFLYYFEDLKGALITALCFCLTTFIASIVATKMSHIFYGFGIWMGAIAGFVVAYLRLQWMEKNLNEHMFCVGNIIERGKGIKPSPKVFELEEQKKVEGSIGFDVNKPMEKEKINEKTNIYH